MSYDLRRRGWRARPIARAAGPRRTACTALAAVACVALAAAACGKQGPPTPPLRAVPAPVKDLAVRQRGTHVLLTFTYPQTTPGGAALNGVTKVEVYEAVPPPPPPLKTPAKQPEKKPAAGKGAATPGAAGAAGTKGTQAAAPPAGAGGTAGATSATAPTAATAAAAGAAGTEPEAAGGAGAAAAAPGGTAGQETAGTAGAGATAAGATAAGTTGAAGAPHAPGAPAAPEPLDPRQFERLAKLRLTLNGKDIGAATLGNLLVVDVQLPEPLPAAPAAAAAGGATATTAAATGGATATTATAAGGATATTTGGATTAAAGGKAPAGAASAPAAPPPLPIHYFAVRAYGPQGDRSALSNQAPLIPKAPPAPPDAITVEPEAEGILVGWKPVAEAGGYAVYRRAATERFSSKPVALVRAPEIRHLDRTARFGQSYIYSVTTVDARDLLIESAIKAEQEIHYVDRYPPPVPEELVAVAEPGRARLVWRQSEASDLAGYIVYRKAPAGDWVRVTAKPILATNYVDTEVVSGQTYDFRVSAIDLTGNESAPSAEVHVAVP